jgi:hypothetical protein
MGAWTRRAQGAAMNTRQVVCYPHRAALHNNKPRALATHACACMRPAGPARLSLSYVVLSGFQLPDPSAPRPGEQPLAPRGLLGTVPTAGLQLTDVRILVGRDSLRQHVEFLARQPSARTYTVSTALAPGVRAPWLCGAGTCTGWCGACAAPTRAA